MAKQISVIIVILISLISTILFSQSSEINEFKSQKFNFYPSKHKVKQEKSSSVFSLGIGLAGLSTQRIGFDVQTDLIFPVTTYLAINASFNYARFPKYQTQSGIIRYDYGVLTHLALSPCLSFGNFKLNDKFNYFVTTGFAIGFAYAERTVYTDINTGNVINSGAVNLPTTIFGILISGRVSYKLSEMFHVL